MSVVDVSRAESTKLFSTAIWWILAIVLAVYVAFTASALGFVFSASATGSLGGGNGPRPDTAAIPSLLYSTATAVGYVFPLLIGTLMVTTEFRHKTLTPTFLATPRRGRVLTAKVVVGIVIGVIYAVIGIVAAVGPAAGFLAGFGLDTAFGSADTWALIGRMVLAFALWALIGIGVGALVRNQVGAIVGVLVFTQFVEPIGRVAGTFVDGLSDVTRFLPGAASDTLVGASIFTGAMGGGADAGGLQWWAGGLVLLGYAVVLLVVGSLVSWRRDVA
jgi:ABC-2 type transport system permease protein